jgi:hypothetical protein
MDQAVAALLGAGIGVVGTVGASMLTYFGVRRQAPDQGRIEHARQLRIERREAYLAFLALLDPLEHVPSGPASSLPAEEYEALAPQARLIHSQGENLLGRIRLCGPVEIARPAADLLGAAFRVAAVFLARSQDQYEIDTAFEDFIEAQAEFITQARQVMTEPPS